MSIYNPCAEFCLLKGIFGAACYLVALSSRSGQRQSPEKSFQISQLKAFGDTSE
jgi:hypothetical protein